MFIALCVFACIGALGLIIAAVFGFKIFVLNRIKYLENRLARIEGVRYNQYFVPSIDSLNRRLSKLESEFDDFCHDSRSIDEDKKETEE